MDLNYMKNIKEINEELSGDNVMSCLPILYKNLKYATERYDEVFDNKNDIFYERNQEDYYDARKDFENAMKIISDVYVGAMKAKFDEKLDLISDNFNNDLTSSRDVALLCYIIELATSNVKCLDSFQEGKIMDDLNGLSDGNSKQGNCK